MATASAAIYQERWRFFSRRELEQFATWAMVGGEADWFSEFDEHLIARIAAEIERRPVDVAPIVRMGI